MAQVCEALANADTTRTPGFRIVLPPHFQTTSKPRQQQQLPQFKDQAQQESATTKLTALPWTNSVSTTSTPAASASSALLGTADEEQLEAPFLEPLGLDEATTTTSSSAVGAASASHLYNLDKRGSGIAAIVRRARGLRRTRSLAVTSSRGTSASITDEREASFAGLRRRHSSHHPGSLRFSVGSCGSDRELKRLLSRGSTTCRARASALRIASSAWSGQPSTTAVTTAAADINAATTATAAVAAVVSSSSSPAGASPRGLDSRSSAAGRACEFLRSSTASVDSLRRLAQQIATPDICLSDDEATASALFACDSVQLPSFNGSFDGINTSSFLSFLDTNRASTTSAVDDTQTSAMAEASSGSNAAAASSSSSSSSAAPHGGTPRDSSRPPKQHHTTPSSSKPWANTAVPVMVWTPGFQQQPQLPLDQATADTPVDANGASDGKFATTSTISLFGMTRAPTGAGGDVAWPGQAPPPPLNLPPTHYSAAEALPVAHRPAPSLSTPGGSTATPQHGAPGAPTRKAVSDHDTPMDASWSPSHTCDGGSPISLPLSPQLESLAEQRFTPSVPRPTFHTPPRLRRHHEPSSASTSASSSSASSNAMSRMQAARTAPPNRGATSATSASLSGLQDMGPLGAVGSPPPALLGTPFQSGDNGMSAGLATLTAAPANQKRKTVRAKNTRKAAAAGGTARSRRSAAIAAQAALSLGGRRAGSLASSVTRTRGRGRGRSRGRKSRDASDDEYVPSDDNTMSDSDDHGDTGQGAPRGGIAALTASRRLAQQLACGSRPTSTMLFPHTSAVRARANVDVDMIMHLAGEVAAEVSPSGGAGAGAGAGAQVSATLEDGWWGGATRDEDKAALDAATLKPVGKRVPLAIHALRRRARLTKPLFGPHRTVVVCTEDQNPTPVSVDSAAASAATAAASSDAGHRKNHLIVSQLTADLSGVMGPPSVLDLPQDAADLHWLGSSDTGSQRLGVALGRGLTVYDIAYEGDAGAPKVSTIASLPTLHEGDIREFAPHPSIKGRVALGGFSGAVAVHDLASLHPEAHTFYSRCEGIVGSVRWHPTDPNLFSCTTDEGWMQLFDVRAKNSVRHWFLSRYLFTHEWLDDHRIVGGYGDGHIQLIDTQQLNAASEPRLKDPAVWHIGEMLLAPPVTGHKGGIPSLIGRPLVCFGCPRFSVWDASWALTGSAGVASSDATTAASVRHRLGGSGAGARKLSLTFKHTAAPVTLPRADRATTALLTKMHLGNAAATPATTLASVSASSSSTAGAASPPVMSLVFDDDSLMPKTSGAFIPTNWGTRCNKHRIGVSDSFGGLTIFQLD